MTVERNVCWGKERYQVGKEQAWRTAGVRVGSSMLLAELAVMVAAAFWWSGRNRTGVSS
jgi:hypothetical protein